MCFGTIRNNTALKLQDANPVIDNGFGTIRNNTALKQPALNKGKSSGFGTIRNNTALKPRGPLFLTRFRNHAIRSQQNFSSERSHS